MKILKEIVVEYEDAKFFFSPLSLEDVLGLGGVNAEQDPQGACAQLVKFLHGWDNVIDEDDKKVEFSPEAFSKKIPAMAALSVIKKFSEACGLTKDFEKNSEAPSEQPKT